MKKIFIYAYTQLNLGDDLFVKILCERYPQHQFYIVSRKSNATAFSQISNLEVIYSIPYVDSVLHKLSLEHIVINRIVNQCDLVVNIGGSIFIEPEKWEIHVEKYRKRINVDKPFYILGSNFGPYTNKGFYEEYQNIFKEAEDICFRDEYSYNLFSKLDNVRLAPDPVFTLDTTSVNENDTSNNIVISVINLENRINLSDYREKYEEKLLEIAIRFISEGHKVTLMSFCEEEGDTVAIKRIHEKIPSYMKGSLQLYNYEGNLNEALSIIKSSEGIVAARFHSLILAWLFGLPVYPMIYSSKTQNVINDIKFQGDSAWIQDVENVNSSEIVSQILNKSNKQNVRKQIEDAQGQFFKLDKVLE